jgi:hypothetical protein
MNMYEFGVRLQLNFQVNTVQTLSGMHTIGSRPEPGFYDIYGDPSLPHIFKMWGRYWLN